MHNVLLISLGCDKNLVDSEVILGILKEAGYNITTNTQEADIIIINTCSFIKEAEQEADTEIKKALKLNNKKIIVCGCLPQKYKEEIKIKYPQINTFLGVDAAIKIKQAITEDNFYHVEEKPQFIYNYKTPRVYSTGQFTTFIKIADGCNNRCSYCLIPKIRGNYRSRKMEDILKEVKEFVNNSNAVEINIIAQDTTYYGYDLYKEYKLAELLRKLCKFNSLKWIRLLYTHPAHFTDELITTIASEEKICKYIDMPLQHASEKILKLMKRENTKDKAITIINKLREQIKDICIRTTFIVGFPYEDDKDYEELLQFVKAIKFDRLGAFIYSKEKDTIAYNYKMQIPDKIKIERYNKLMQLQKEISKEKNRKFVGKDLEVLIEQKKGPSFIGRSYRDAPNIDGVVYVKNYSGRIGNFINVRISEAKEYDLIGTV